MNKKTKIIVEVIVAIIVVGVAFYGGMLYKGSQVSAQRVTFGAGRTGGTGRFATGANFVTGTITAKDSQSITLKARDGSSRVIFYSGSTEVGKFVAGSTDDVQVGQIVMVNGKTNSDGSISAQSIQIRPAMLPQGQTTNSTGQ